MCLGLPESFVVVSAYVCVTVTDDSILEMIEKRKQTPRLPGRFVLLVVHYFSAMVYLEDEVDHLEDAQFYFDPKEDSSKLAIDLLLGTQGWRRFVFDNNQDFLAKHGDKAERVLLFHEAEVCSRP